MDHRRSRYHNDIDNNDDNDGDDNVLERRATAKGDGEGMVNELIKSSD